MDNKPQAKRVTAKELLKILKDLEGQPVTRLAIYGYTSRFGDNPATWPEAVRGPHCYHIENLDDSHCQAITRLRQLQHLLMSSVGLTATQMRSIAENLTQLTSLYVRNNKIGEAGARAIAENLTQLTSLDVRYNLIGDAGARAIAENLTQLTSLYVSDN